MKRQDKMSKMLLGYFDVELDCVVKQLFHSMPSIGHGDKFFPTAAVTLS